MGMFQAIGKGRLIVRDRVINKVGLDSGILVTLVDNDQEWNLSHARYFLKNGKVVVYQLVVNETIGVLISGRKYDRKKAILDTLSFLKRNNIQIIKEQDFDMDVRNSIYEVLRKERNKIKQTSKPEDSDLDILASYKTIDVDCIITTNFKHLIELGKKIGIYIEPIRTTKNEELKKVDKMWRQLFWRPR